MGLVAIGDCAAQTNDDAPRMVLAAQAPSDSSLAPRADWRVYPGGGQFDATATLASASFLGTGLRKGELPTAPEPETVATADGAYQQAAPTAPKAAEAQSDLAQAEGGQNHDPSAEAPPEQTLDTATEMKTDQMLAQSQGGIISSGGDLSDLDLALGQRPVYSELRKLQYSILEMQRPITNLVTRESSQSDGLDISQAELSQDLFFYKGRGRLRLGLQSAFYSPSVGDKIAEYSGGVDGSYRINDWAAITGDIWVNKLSSAILAADVIPTYDLFVTLWPNDFIRVDLDTNRKTFDNVTSLIKGITADSVGGSIDYKPSDDFRLTLRGSGSSYADGNAQGSGEAEAVWRIDTRPTIELGLLATGFHFSKQLNDGYFNPGNYVSGQVMFRIQSTLTKNLNVEFAASAGIENADPGGNKPVIKSSLQLSYQLSKDWTLDGGAAYFSSRESNSSGFARTSINLGLHRKI